MYLIGFVRNKFGMLMAFFLLIFTLGCKSKIESSVRVNSEEKPQLSETPASNDAVMPPANTDKLPSFVKTSYEIIEGIVGKTEDIKIDINFNGAPAKITFPELTAPLSFKGGDFPGAGGTCAETIVANCSIVLSASVSKPLKVQSKVLVKLGSQEQSLTFNMIFRGLFGRSHWQDQDYWKFQHAAVGGGTIVDGRLIVADPTANRVVIWNTIPTSSEIAPDLVLGQPGLTYAIENNGGRSAKSLSSPSTVHSDGTKILVADRGNNRLLIWQQIPTTNYTPADLVLGQANFTDEGNNGDVTATTFNPNYGTHFDGNRIAVVDTQNNRVLIWSSLPTTNNQAPDIVLGQPDFTSNVANNDGFGDTAVSASSLHTPNAAFIAGDRLFIADANNNRVLIWNTFPTTNFQPADYVLGQPDMTSNAKNSGDASVANQNSFKYPNGVHFADDTLWVVETANNRVVGFHFTPATDLATLMPQPDADIVLGQPDYSSSVNNNGGLSASSLDNPRMVYSGNGKFTIADGDNRRLLLWNSKPTSINEPADLALFQKSLTITSSAFQATRRDRLFKPTKISVTGGRLYLSDTQQDRILVWNNPGTVFSSLPDHVIGQPDFTSSEANYGGLSASSLHRPRQVLKIGEKYVILDRENSRVLIYDERPENATAASVVVGQNSMSAGLPAVGQNRLRTPSSICTDGTKLIVGDHANYRILIWNTLPTSDGKDADIQIGQDTFTSRKWLAPSATRFSPIGDCIVAEDKLLVADSANSRVLIWNTIPTSDNTPADVVIGQPDMTSNTPNNGGISARTIDSAVGELHYADGKLYVADNANNFRILVFDGIPTTNFAAADHVIGQTDFISQDINLARQGTPLTNGIMVYDKTLFIVDHTLGRLLGEPL